MKFGLKKKYLLAILINAVIVFKAMAGDLTLYVFYPSPVRPQVLQKQLSDELGGVVVTVFGRYIDFAEQVKTSPPDAILTRPETIEQFGSYRVSLDGDVNGNSVEQWYLLYAKKESAEKEPSALSIGAVDFLGRDAMDTVVRKILGASPKLKRVTKVEDLLPLLTFSMADAVLVSAKNADYLSHKSNIHFFRKEAGKEKTGIVGLAVKKDGSGGNIVSLVKRLSPGLCSSFDIQEWREP